MGVWYRFGTICVSVRKDVEEGMARSCPVVRSRVRATLLLLNGRSSSGCWLVVLMRCKVRRFVRVARVC